MIAGQKFHTRETQRKKKKKSNTEIREEDGQRSGRRTETAPESEGERRRTSSCYCLEMRRQSA